MTTATQTEVQDNGQPEQVEGIVLTLPQKILAVVQGVEDVELDGRNEHFKYDYATATAILRALRRPLAEQGVLLLSDLTEISERQNGRSMITTVRIKFTFVDTETSERLEAAWAGSGDDPSDKGLYKAYTGAIKTFLRETFLLPLGEDPEADTRADKRAESPNGQAAEEAKLTDEQAERLTAVVEEAGLTKHLPSKLRGFGVEKLTDLTTQQAIKVYEWAKGGESE